MLGSLKVYIFRHDIALGVASAKQVSVEQVCVNHGWITGHCCPLLLGQDM